ncbi:MAG: Protocatechuate 3,4-dioxygenase alpha chain [Herbaspirillum sp.]|jgi:protocatechuate 3,4-dioxygenase alpha subunit|nr:Protocatechuate 3,4-dioxygenase alpha chain [Herbaspirillum sp.]
MTATTSAPAGITSSQTVGPFPHEAWRWAFDATAKVDSNAPTVFISGVIRDGDGKPIDDAVIEIWSPEAAAAESAHAIPGFRRMPSDDTGAFRFEVSLPTSPMQGKPAMFVTVFARGVVKHQFCAVFLSDDTGLADSAILNQIPPARRGTLIAEKLTDREYRWDIWMQTDKETVFFDYE